MKILFHVRIFIRASGIYVFGFNDEDGLHHTAPSWTKSKLVAILMEARDALQSRPD